MERKETERKILEAGKEQKSAIYCKYRLKGKRKNESGREGWKEEKAGKNGLGSGREH